MIHTEKELALLANLLRYLNHPHETDLSFVPTPLGLDVICDGDKMGVIKKEDDWWWYEPTPTPPE